MYETITPQTILNCNAFILPKYYIVFSYTYKLYNNLYVYNNNSYIILVYCNYKGWNK